jgi:predicted ATPase
MEGDFQSTKVPEQPTVGFPTQLTPFVGRREEITQIKANLSNEDCRLLTLIGPGGIGKTRLSIEVGEELSGQFHDGACFVPLAPVFNQPMMVNTIAQSLGVQLTDPLPARQQLLTYLQDKEMLLVCDNFEQLIDSAAFLGEIVTQAPGVRLLVTSRQPLNVQAEWRQTVSGLDYSQGEESEAVRFFKRNARRVAAHFQLDSLNLTAVLDLCHLVEGMPLALEIAAAWTRLMDCPTILSETQRSLEFLTSPLDDLPDRHRSVQAVLAQSWEMLPLRLESILGQLALFGGSFTLEAALAVVADLTMLDIATLLDRSLVHWRSNGRYQMHELLRQFVQSQSFSEPDGFRQAYSYYYLTFTAQQEDQLTGAEPRKAIAAVEQEIANVRLAWRWAVNLGAADLLENSLAALLAYYQFQGSYNEGQEQFAAAANALPPSVLVNHLRLAEASCRQRLGDLAGAVTLVEGVIESALPETKLAAFIALARLNEKRSEYDTAIGILQEALALAGPNSRESAEIWTILGSIYSYRGPMEKRIEAQKKALAINVALEDRLQTAECHNLLSMIYKDLGEYNEALAHIEQALTVAEEMNHRENIGRFTQKLGQIYWRMDELEKAKENYEKALTIAMEINHKRLISICSGGLGVLAKRRREYEVALQYYWQSVQLAMEIDDKSIQAVYLGNTGNAYMDLGQYDRAIETLKEAAELDRSIGAKGGVARHQANIGDAYKFQGLFEEALPFFEAAITPIREIEGNYYLCWVLVSYAQCLLALGRVEEARAANQEGGKVAAEIDRSYYLLMSLLLEAQMEASEGKLDDVAGYFEELRRRFTTLEMVAEIDEMLWQITGDTAARESARESLSRLYEETKRERFRRRAANLYLKK